MLGVNPSLMLLSPLQRRPLQPCRVLGRVADRWAEHHDGHSLLGLPALRGDHRSRLGKGMDAGGVSLTKANTGVQGLPPALPELAWPAPTCCPPPGSPAAAACVMARARGAWGISSAYN